jgi:hypothetical protein
MKTKEEMDYDLAFEAGDELGTSLSEDQLLPAISGLLSNKSFLTEEGSFAIGDMGCVFYSMAHGIIYPDLEQDGTVTKESEEKMNRLQTDFSDFMEKAAVSWLGVHGMLEGCGNHECSNCGEPI